MRHAKVAAPGIDLARISNVFFTASTSNALAIRDAYPNAGRFESIVSVKLEVKTKSGSTAYQL